VVSSFPPRHITLAITERHSVNVTSRHAPDAASVHCIFIGYYMKVTFAPNNSDGPTGTVSFASWDNRDLQDAIRKAFNESPRETIVEIIVERSGIKAVFEPKNVSR
jgi:hypothetical protein